MACPEKRQIEDLVIGNLGPKDSQHLIEHLAECQSCRKEAAFMTSLRLSIPESSKTAHCLSDESLVHLVDGTLPKSEQNETLDHLADCPRCLSDWLYLTRALEEATSNAISAPARLVRKAIVIGAPPVENESWLQRIFGQTPWLRLGVASATAIAAFLVVLFLSKEPIDSVRTVPEKDSSLTARRLAPQGEELNNPDRKVATQIANEPKQPDLNVQQPLVNRQPDKQGSLQEPVSGQLWMNALSASDQQRLISRLKLNVNSNSLEMGHALDSSPKKNALEHGFLMGEILFKAQAFSGQLNRPEAKHQIKEELELLAWTLYQIVGEKTEKENLTGFVNQLGQSLSEEKISPDSFQRKLQVLSLGLQDALSTQEGAQLGYELGQLSSSLKIFATALDLGLDPPPQLYPDQKSFQQTLHQLEKSTVVPPTRKNQLLSNLEQLRKIDASAKTPSKASKILEELQGIERDVRASR